jgi:hypothetical protein
MIGVAENSSAALPDAFPSASRSQADLTFALKFLRRAACSASQVIAQKHSKVVGQQAHVQSTESSVLRRSRARSDVFCHHRLSFTNPGVNSK